MERERENFQTVTALLNILAAYSLFALKLKKKQRLQGDEAED